MTEQAKRFVKEAQTNEVLQAELKALEQLAAGKTIEDARKELQPAVCALANEYGYELSEADFQGTAEMLSDDDLEALSGGWGSCQCVLLGGGAGENDQKFGGACLLGGFSFGKDGLACICMLGGSGY